MAIIVPDHDQHVSRVSGMNPIPFVYIVTMAANYGLMLPSSSAGPAIAAGYGVNLWTMISDGSGSAL